MKEELLILLKEELKKQKLEKEEQNKKVRRIKELLKEPNVREYVELINSIDGKIKQNTLSDEEMILLIYRRYFHKIEEKDTNNIYVYLGTYAHSYETDIIHGSNDFRVNYDSPGAAYRSYINLEQLYEECIPIKYCDGFEKDHIILNPKSALTQTQYYKIQEEFFVKAVKTNQESAKKMILKKYNK